MIWICLPAHSLEPKEKLWEDIVPTQRKNTREWGNQTVLNVIYQGKLHKHTIQLGPNPLQWQSLLISTDASKISFLEAYGIYREAMLDCADMHHEQE